MVYFISIAALVAVFAIATVRPINMGILGFVAAFLVGGLLSGIAIEDIQALFPGDMFMIVFGITLLFGVATANGTIDLIMGGALRVVRGRPWAVLWLMFLLAAILMALGSVMAVGMLAPIAMPLAKRYGIDPLLMGMMLSHGALAAAFSPITVYSVGIGELMDDQGIDLSAPLLFAVPFALNLLMATVLFLVRGRSLLGSTDTIVSNDVQDGSGAATPGPGGSTGGRTVGQDSGAGTLVAEQTGTASSGPTRDNWLTFAAMVGLLAAALGGIDIGVTSICLAAVLLLLSPGKVEASMRAVAWPAVLLVCGVVTYMGVLTENGTIDYLGARASEIPWPLLTALMMFLAVGIISAVGSSFGIILISLPLAAPLLESGQLGAAGFVIALSFCATVVDVSPFSTNGIIVLASAQVDDKHRLQGRMLAYTGIVVVVAPLLALLTVVVPTSV